MMSNSSHDASKPYGCFSSLLHRFLCSGGLPTHPSSDTDSPKKPPSSTTNPNPSSTTTTTPVGIVARLMGLDSMIPNRPPVMQKSRSLGSLDLYTKHHITHHRRAVSFREHDLIGNPDMGLTPIIQDHKEKEQVPLKTRRKIRVVVVDDGFPDHANSKCKSRDEMRSLKRRETGQDHYCIKVLNEVCRLTMIELQGCVWVNNNNIEAEISYEIGQQILQLLVHEIVDDLYVTNLSSWLNTVSYINS